MALNLTQKLIKEHLVSGEMQAGREISIKIDQTLTQDATGTTAYLEFEAIGTKKVKTELSVSYIDHNTLQTGYENADDHAYLKSVAARYGLYCSRAGNGICHQVHLERFAKPGATLLGSDSHTPTCGGMGMLAIGAGGVDVAAAMAGYPLFLNMPRVVNVRLTGRLRPWVSAKDIILEMLRRLTVKGGVGKVFEYTGEGAEYLSVPERSTIANMGAELGATSSVFASDEQTKRFLAAQGREGDFTPLSADKGASYDEEMEIDLSALDSLIAQPHMPDRVVPVKELSGLKIDQVFVGSCTNSSYMDLVRVAKILKGKTVHPDVSMTVAPGSRQAFEMIAREGYLADLIQSGVRILESACGPCAGLGQAPQTNGVSLRTSNRNFEGRCGSLSAKVYLAGAETCAISAINGVLTEPSTFEGMTPVEMPKRFIIDDSMIIKPSPDDGEAPIKRGPGIVALPEFQPLENAISSPVVLKLDDNISTDHIIPAGASILSLRSDAPKLARFAFSRIDPDFYERIQKEGNGIIVAGQNYGQGSSREHAALCPRILGVRVVIAKSFARIHQQNLVNFGIVPLIFENEEAYDHVHMNDRLEIDDLVKNLLSGVVPVKNITRGGGFSVKNLLTSRQTNIVISGGLLKYVLDYSPLHAHD